MESFARSLKELALSGTIFKVNLLGLLRVSEYSDNHGSDKKFKYEYFTAEIIGS